MNKYGQTLNPEIQEIEELVFYGYCDSCMACDPAGVLYFAQSNKIWRWSPGAGALRSYQFAEGFSVNKIFAPKKENLYIATSGGLLTLENGEWTLFNRENSPIHGTQITSASMDQNFRVYMGFYHDDEAALSVFDRGNWTKIDFESLPEDIEEAESVDALGMTGAGEFKAIDEEINIKELRICQDDILLRHEQGLTRFNPRTSVFTPLLELEEHFDDYVANPEGRIFLINRTGVYTTDQAGPPRQILEARDRANEGDEQEEIPAPEKPYLDELPAEAGAILDSYNWNSLSPELIRNLYDRRRDLSSTAALLPKRASPNSAGFRTCLRTLTGPPMGIPFSATRRSTAQSNLYRFSPR